MSVVPIRLKTIRIPGLYRFAGLYVLVLLVIVFSLLLPETFPTILDFRTMLVSQSFLAIAALGLLFAAINGEFDLSIGFLSGFVGALVAWLSIDHGWPAMAAVANLCVLIVSHNIPQILAVADRIWVLRAGRLVAQRLASETNHADIVGHITGMTPS